MAFTTFRQAVSEAWALPGAMSEALAKVVWADVGDLLSHVQTVAMRQGLLLDDGSAEDTLHLFGAERGMPRYPGETEAGYRARLHGAWDAYGVGGSDGGIIAQLEAAGYTGAAIYTARDDWYPGDPDWSRYWVVIQLGTHSVTGPGVAWGGGREWGDGWLWGIATGADDVTTVAAIVGKWNPVRWRCVGLVFVGAGVAWGTISWGAFTWGGSVVSVGV